MISSLAIAQQFSPQVLKITGQTAIHYGFDGSDLSIPVYVSGKPAKVYLTVFTNGKADQIVGVKNGNLGWHYMNMIDTCVYVSGAYDFGQGTNEVSWDGNVSENDGTGSLPADTYTYYLWGFDYVNQRELAVSVLPYSWKCDSRIVTTNEDGTIKTKPMISDQPDDDTLQTEWTTYRYMRWNLATLLRIPDL